MSKYYYTDPLKAAWMSKEFKINLQIPHAYLDEDYGMLNVTCLQVDASEDGTVHYVEAENEHGEFVFGGRDPDDRYSGEIYVHPDCHGILKPQIGDLWQMPRPMSSFYLITEGDIRILKEAGYNRGEIIQRNGKAFFTPEMEE